MSKRIDTIKKYKALFFGKKAKSKKKSDGDIKGAESQVNRIDKAKLALDYALEIRKFEIDLYWRRTAYFWTLITVAFGGYFSLGTAGDNSIDKFIIACLGLVLSVAWYLVNRGSKFWQENWEMHVDCLEDDVIGPLYKTTKSKDSARLFKFWEGYPFSVSKINQLISLFAIVAWCLLIMKVVPNGDFTTLNLFYENPRKIVFGFALLFIACMFLLANGNKLKLRSKESNNERLVDFEYNELKDS